MFVSFPCSLDEKQGNYFISSESGETNRISSFNIFAQGLLHFQHILAFLPLYGHSQRSVNISVLMDAEWCPAFCLTCDRQTDGGAYCSPCQYSHKLLDFEIRSLPTTPVASSSSGIYLPPSRGFHLPPAFDFSRYRRNSPSSVRVKASTRTSKRPSMSDTFEHRKVPKEKVHLSKEERELLGSYAYSFDLNRRWKRRMLVR